MKFALTIPGISQPIRGPSGIPTGGIETGDLNHILGVLIGVIFVFSVLFALVNMVRAGLNWIMSRGDKEKLQTARSRIQYSVLGLVVIFLSFLIVNLIGHLFGVKLIGP